MTRPRQADPDPDLLAVEGLAARLVREPAAFAGVAALAAAAGVGRERLEELVERHFHSTPVRLLRGARVAAAQRLLVATGRPLAAVAADVGFAGLPSFAAAFRRLAAMAPADYRRLAAARDFTLRLPSSFQLGRTLAYLGRDPESRSERLRGRSYAMGTWLAEVPARLEVELAPGRARCTIVCRRRLPEGAAVAAHAQLLRRLGLTGDPRPFEAAVAGRPDLAALVDGRRGLRIPLTAEPFECLLWAICGQQVNLAFARAMLGRLVERAGSPVGAGLAAPPRPAAVAALTPAELARQQFSRQKIDYLLGAARRLAAGDLDLAGLAAGSATRAQETLAAVRGLGPWSVGYVMMRGLGFGDCVPLGDSGLTRALQRFFHLDRRPDAVLTRELMLPFSPHRSLATFHLWQTLEDVP
jgi:3-methyladenine DNA glycosylase/8-oxoguanine DNA glycosylase/AraC-like DNA-binding protein